MWARPKVALVEGEVATPLQRLMMFVDSAGGMSRFVDMKTTSFINADMTVNVLRTPDSDWICTQARTDCNAVAGVGMVNADISDESGLVAHVTQSQLLSRL